MAGINKLVIPEAKKALYKFKMESAKETGVNLEDGYNRNLTTTEASLAGRNMVKSHEENLK